MQLFSLLASLFLLYHLLSKNESKLAVTALDWAKWLVSGAFLHPNGSPERHRHLPGPRSFPVIGARWMFWKWIGPFAK